MAVDFGSCREKEAAEQPKRAFIYTGGDIYPDNITECPKEGDICIAADSGYLNALKMRQKVDFFIGDCDSLAKNNLPDGIDVTELNPEKDLTDTQAAVELALAHGAGDIIIVGGIGSRLDHTMSNLFILEDMWQRGVYCKIVNGCNRVSYINSTSTLVAKSKNYKYLSLIAADKKVRGVSIDGCKYPLKNQTLTRNFQFAVSNEIIQNCALISVKRGGIFIVESVD